MSCPFCGGESEKLGKPCDRQECTEARARIPLAKADSRGISEIRKGWCSQNEAERVRKGLFLRILPDVAERGRRYARARNASLSELVERWLLSLPLE